MSQIYLALEISTQQFKVVAIDDDLNVVYEDGIKFQEEFPDFRTLAGVHHHKDGKTVTAPTLMWVKSLDVAFDRMKKKSFDFHKVCAISGTAQQHGSVYWSHGSKKLLENLDPGKSFHEQLQTAFSIKDSPIWMDSSTEVQCLELEREIGGPLELSKITGCQAYHRMTGNQIAKIYQTVRLSYDSTERISLISSFLASLMLGDYAPIDCSDGSGMNLMDIKAKQWSTLILEILKVDELSDKLGPIVNSCDCVGNVSSYLVERYGFNPECKVIAFTGDNPASLAGMRPNPEDIIISLGTSDTVMFLLNEPKACIEGMILINPIDPTSYMGMLCFKNGSLSREKVKEECGLSSWQQFDDLLMEGVPGNHGNIGIYFHSLEITPATSGILRWNDTNESVKEFEPRVEVRALIEGQMLARRIYSEKLGLDLKSAKRVLATGGASNSSALLQIVSDVFGVPVFVQQISNSACLGSAYRAKHACSDEQLSFYEAIPDECCPKYLAASPCPESVAKYNNLVERYMKLEESLISNMAE